MLILKSIKHRIYSSFTLKKLFYGHVVTGVSLNHCGMTYRNNFVMLKPNIKETILAKKPQVIIVSVMRRLLVGCRLFFFPQV